MNKRKKLKKSIADRIFDAGNIAVLTLFALICVYPFYYIIIYSISGAQEAASGLYLLPKGVSFKAYEALFQTNDVILAALVSISRAVIGTAVTVFCSSFLAYLVTKKEMFLRSLVYRFIIMTMYVSGGLIPWYITMKELGLKDNFLLYVLPSAVGAFYVVLIKTFMEQIPQELEESAKVDGATYFISFIRIIFPLSKPILATVAIFSAVGQWNAWQDNFYLVNNKNLMTLQYLLYNYLNITASSAQNVVDIATAQSRATAISASTVRMAISVITILPIMVVYPLMQKYFVKGIMLGAVKG